MNYLWVGDVHMDRAAVGETVVIVGGGLTGCETALHLARQGKKVTIIDMLSLKQLTADISYGLLTLLSEKGVRFLTDVKLEKITNKGVALMDKTWKRVEVPADTVVLSLGFKPRTDIIDAFNILPEVYVIGDCREVKDLKQAIHDGFNAAVEI